MDKLGAVLDAVSDPQSEYYGQHLTNDEVHQLVAPKTEDVLKVVGWLQSVDPSINVNFETKNGDFLSVDVTAAQVYTTYTPLFSLLF